MCSKIITEVRLNNLLANFYFLASTYLMAYYTVLSFGVEVALHDRRMVEDGRKQKGGRRANNNRKGARHHLAPRRMMYCLHFFNE